MFRSIEVCEVDTFRIVAWFEVSDLADSYIDMIYKDRYAVIDSVPTASSYSEFVLEVPSSSLAALTATASYEECDVDVASIEPLTPDHLRMLDSMAASTEACEIVRTIHFFDETYDYRFKLFEVEVEIVNTGSGTCVVPSFEPGMNTLRNKKVLRRLQITKIFSWKSISHQ